MKLLTLVTSYILLEGLCNGQTKNRTMEKQHSDPLTCDTATGLCEMPGLGNTHQKHGAHGNEKPLKIIYFTDPICSSCWGIEPQLRKLKLEYGNIVEIEYRMGGLLPDWSYNSGGISKPSDVAHHWDEVSTYYDMPIDGDIWLEDPLASSYPPSIAFKAAQMQNHEKSILFLRELREMVFLRKKNISKWENISVAAQKAGLDVTRLKTDFEDKAKDRFNEDLQLGRKLGIRGFPSILIIDRKGQQQMIAGSKPYSVYVQAITKLHSTHSKRPYDTSWQGLFSKYATLTSREFAELSGTPRKDADSYLQELYAAGKLRKLETKNGALWLSK